MKHSERIAELSAELQSAQALIRELQRNALPSNCTHCNGIGAEPPGCPEAGPCEWCGGWTTHKRLVAGECTELRSRAEAVKKERDALRDDLHEALNLAEAAGDDGPNAEDVARLRAIAEGKRPPGWSGETAKGGAR